MHEYVHMCLAIFSTYSCEINPVRGILFMYMTLPIGIIDGATKHVVA